MRIRYGNICLLAVFTLLINACNKANSEDDKYNYEYIVLPDGKEEKVKEATIDTTIKNGITVSILPAEWMDYYDDSADYENISYFYNLGVENTTPRYPVARWMVEGNVEKYTVLLADNKMMENPVSFETTEKRLEFKDLYAGNHYYYQIKADFADKTVISKRFDFKTADFFRTIKIEGVLNARDLGNKKTEDGKKRIKQGLVYRTANFDSVTPQGVDDAINKYGIKTDLDLREQGPTSSPLGALVNYVNNGQGTYGSPLYVSYDNGINSEDYHEPMKENLKMFANANNLPLAFHCAVGRDRTGTLAITLELLLGIELNQIKQDYVVSFFSSVCAGASFANLNSSMNSLFNYFTQYKSNDGTNKGTIYERAERYCLDIGLTKAEIESIRNNLLEDVTKE